MRLTLALCALALGACQGCGEASASSTVEVVVDVGARSHRISPYIYGINGLEHLEENEGVFTLVRFGGTRTSTYNWENNASNAGHDPPINQNDGWLSESTEPGAAVLEVLDAAQRIDGAAIVTVPMIGRVAADRNADGDVARTPDYLERRFVPSLARGGGDGPPDLEDHAVYQDQFVRFVDREARARGVRVLYALDNEVGSWPVTHPRLREGRPVRYAEIVQRSVDYAAMISDEARDARVLGPVSFGWADMTSLAGAPDGNGRNFLIHYLREMQQAERRRRRRLLDVLDVHWYPDAQVDGRRVSSSADDDEVARLRMQIPRSLWDETYEEPTWIPEELDDAVKLVPRLRGMIWRSYRGTRVALSEYAYGGGAHISGAVAQAEALGAFGRFGVYAAAYWPLFGQEHDYALAAFRMFRRVDGEVSFGDRSIPATSSDRSRLSAWASVDSRVDGRVVIVLVGRADRAFTAKLRLRGTEATPARRFVLDRHRAAPRELPSVEPTNGAYNVPIPARSVTTLIWR